MNKKIITKALLVGMSLMMLTGCGKKKKEKPTTEAPTTTEATTEQTTKATTEATTEDAHHGLVQSDLNGEWVKPEVAKKRPIAVMINNIDVSWPQSSISKADVIYEMTAEGGITRLLAVYSDYSNLEKIGSVRSARQYFVMKSVEHDAILVHVGGSTWGKEAIANNNVDDIDGLDETYFYRTDDREAPHNCYISTKLIDESIDYHGYERNHSSSYKNVFDFNEEDTPLASGEDCNKLTVRYNSFTIPYFEYDKDKKVYKRFEYDTAHIDDTNNEQVTCKNIFVLFTTVSIMPDGKYSDVELNGSGEGYYATDGKIVHIKWERSGDDSVTRFYTDDGKAIKLNPGKTNVEYFDVEDSENVTWEK
ncbi:Protein of unknown function [Eubacterium ruminantium]|uniref:DUF3048 domain-containing protein n=1 Tax=Eubacterium ruminantium TaxID=42322 RepID=A0A1T4LY99_9FIRM|nr:DUF3048 domain-containing protein [Eubacterium ruminantium]SCW38516.1 Protein of unknown function [Eubacterium ruminantium]SDM44258.1 Protein of unknown function [Eubacterium ruminantium]SJZ59611.1 Protein of unknown function [Eubacterium ruminantium]